MENLKSCPFCGGNAKEAYDCCEDNGPDGNIYYVTCGTCGARGEGFFAKNVWFASPKKEEQEAVVERAKCSAIESWNNRTRE